MKKKEQGAWIVNHTKKLKFFESTDFEDIELAGKAGIFLSNLAASDQESTLSKEKVSEIAKVSNLKKTEIETVKSVLKSNNLIDTSASGDLTVIGVTSSTVLAHTSDIFQNNNPSSLQKAALELSNNVSELPKDERQLKEYISDSFKLAAEENSVLFAQAEEAGLIDFEQLDIGQKLYFNGNLFKRDASKKVAAVLGSLKSAEIAKIQTIDQELNQNGCVSHQKAKQILGEQLLEKLNAIGMYDYNEITNSTENTVLLTKPSAFSKFGNPFEEDAFDLAKAFVSSLYYGMNHSDTSRGKIWGLKLLMRKLIAGEEVGPADAIGEDYKMLELHQVVQLRYVRGNMYSMRLLKKDVGILALQVLEEGSATDSTIITALQSGSVTGYTGPEQKRQFGRKKQLPTVKKDIANILRTFRQ